MKLSAAVLPLLAALILVGAPGAMTGSAAGTQDYVIAFAQEDGLPANADQIVETAGGKISKRLAEIGGVVASSENPGFAAAVVADPAVESVSTSELRLFSAPDAGDDQGAVEAPGADPQPGTEPLYGQQWDKMRMNASATGSYAVQPGRREVTVAVLDTGADVSHPDIAPNLDSRSRSFVPSEPTIADGNGHGTWNLSAVGAPINSFGISGVAPNVSLVALKVFDRNGAGNLLWAEEALIYAGEQHFDIVVMSWGIFGDRKADKAEITLFERSLKFARKNGVTAIAALGNHNFDLSSESMREAVLVPGGLKHVVGVSSTGYRNRKAFYSSYGMGETDVSAPGGDSITQPAPGYGGGGRVLGAWSAVGIGRIAPPWRVMRCVGVVCGWYAWMQGTSMATPNAAGVAALIVSQYGDFKTKGKVEHMPPGHLEQALQQAANNQACPDPATVTYPMAPGPGLPNAATCQGDSGYNNFFGKGIVDALKAVTAK